jgi:hypothetical protein
MWLPNNILEIVNFIRSHSTKLNISTWTDAQIACYLGEKIAKKEVILLTDDEATQKPIGIIFFHPKSSTEIYIEQFWVRDKEVFRKFLALLKSLFPSVNTLTAWHQRRERNLIFNVDKLIRIYG